MKFNGKRIKEDGKYQKHEAYKISQNRTICFKEEQEDGSVDTVELEISLGENQEAIFSEEYKPKMIDVSKMVDITVFLYYITEKQCIDTDGQACLYLYDVKDTIGGKDVIFHLIEQWKAGITSALDFTRYIGDTKYRIGVITRDYNVERVEKEITKCEEEIKKLDFREDMPKLIMAKNSSRKMVAIQELKILKDFKNMAFYKGNQKYTYDYMLLDEHNFCKFEISF